MKNLSLLFFCLLCVACSQTPQIEHDVVEPTVIFNDIESRMPGSLMILDHYAIWSDPLSADDQVHVINLQTNQEIGKFLDIGNGPNEFVTPDYTLTSNNNVIVYDTSQDKMSFYSIDSLEKQKNPLLMTIKAGTKGYTRIIDTQGQNFVKFKPDNKYPFLYDQQPFGKCLFEKEEEFNNRFDVLQGNIAYNRDNQTFIYSAFDFPYIAAYKKEEQPDNFRLLWERKGDIDYYVSEGKMILDRTRMGAMELALTKDYIVTVQRDYQTDPTDESRVGRDFSLCPQTLFVYDYQSNLKRIIDFKMPILRIGSDIKNNTIYAIVVNPDFCLVKYDILQ